MIDTYNIEEYFLNAPYIWCDDNYMSDGNILVNKKYLCSPAIKLAKNFENIWDEMELKVPYEKGVSVNYHNAGTRAELGTHNKIYVIHNDSYAFNYDYIKLLHYSVLNFGGTTEYTVVENDKKVPLLKVFDTNDFVGLISPSWRNK